MSENPPVPAALQTLLLICETDQQREELTHCYYATLGGDPSSPILQLATLISAVAAAGRKNNGNGELAAHLADLKKSEALKASQAPEIRKYLEQLNSVQGEILKRLRTLPASPAGDDNWVQRLAWQTCIGLGILLLGFLLGTLIESRKENDRLTSVIGSLPYSMQAPALLQSHGGGVGITSDGRQLVVSSGACRTRGSQPITSTQLFRSVKPFRYHAGLDAPGHA
jgi:hypothetical protein